jgi:hypothetical protein
MFQWLVHHHHRELFHFLEKPTTMTDNNVIIVAGFQGTGIVVPPDDGAQTQKHVGDKHQTCIYIIDIVHLVGINPLEPNDL